jgi:hypothetical protein
MAGYSACITFPFSITSCLPDDSDVIICLYDFMDKPSNVGMVIDEEDLDHGATQGGKEFIYLP